MTSKETVLKVYPDAWLGGLTFSSTKKVFSGPVNNPRECKELGIGQTEEAAWQNAADSLPPQTEEGKCNCGAWICQGCLCCSSDCGCAEPKIPCKCWFKDKQVCDICQQVEAKDKPINERCGNSNHGWKARMTCVLPKGHEGNHEDSTRCWWR